MAILSISLTVPDNKAVQINEDFCAYHGWKSTIPDPQNPQATIPNPETKNAFIKRKVGEFIKESVLAFNANKDVQTARQSAINAINAITFS
jgi:hypothetical protein